MAAQTHLQHDDVAAVTPGGAQEKMPRTKQNHPKNLKGEFSLGTAPPPGLTWPVTVLIQCRRLGLKFWGHHGKGLCVWSFSFDSSVPAKKPNTTVLLQNRTMQKAMA
ncbi:unnamed protein product [Arctogadus glacialis]